MTAPRAADLPVGSQIGYRGAVITRLRDWSSGSGQRWQGGDHVLWSAYDADRLLAAGAQVLRVGDGSEGAS